MEVLFEDKELIVIIKERGLLSEEHETKPTMVTSLKEYTKGEIFPVHRLDKDVGGVMVYAKTKRAAAELSKQVGDRTMEKIYLARVHGVTEEKESVPFADGVLHPGIRAVSVYPLGFLVHCL